ncbi:probable E3 ubiquitin-protein ligase RNF217 [Telopea speciosissima]|uniref:probable E3 ubiquitin-protein ligase RNF217 n=1 Tax=Telopea speciosissima TaxID=54955 RepID=UPI001CC43C9D|nr:probable E3 ubiquitin-protein ligase RNF217 [Telopea speciosissima]
MHGDKTGGRDVFRNMTTCRHSYCRDCIGKHVASKIQENAKLVKCPDLNCKTVLEPHHCRSVVPDEVLVRWSTTLCDSLILGSSRFYCPFKDCSGVMQVDNEGEVIRASECPYCRRLFCAHCKVPWHSEISCEEFQRLDKNDTTRQDLMAVELAKKLRWKRCPQCSFFVEKRDGCLHITCRCGFEFCYRCGSTWTETHGSCEESEV